MDRPGRARTCPGYSLMPMARTLGDRPRAGSGFPRRWSRIALVFLAAAVCVSQLLSPATVGPAPSASAASPCTGGALTIVAHTDDDLLFLNPHILQDIEAGRC